MMLEAVKLFVVFFIYFHCFQLTLTCENNHQGLLSS